MGATNARLAITEDCKSLVSKASYKMSEFKSLKYLLKHYIVENNISDFEIAGIIGVAAPVISNEVNFVNNNFSFSIKEIESSFFQEGLKVLNDVQMQTYALNNYSEDKLIKIGNEINFSSGPKILVVPGTGLGLAILISGKSIATEAGHMNVPGNNNEIINLLDDFKRKNRRLATFEDLISGKGISYIYGVISKNFNHNLSNYEIIKNANNDNNCFNTKKTILDILAIFLRYSALTIGSIGGIYLAGSLVTSLFENIDFDNFRTNFEKSETMDEFLKRIPLYLIKEDNLGFLGALEVCRNTKNEI